MVIMQLFCLLYEKEMHRYKVEKEKRVYLITIIRKKVVCGLIIIV